MTFNPIYPQKVMSEIIVVIKLYLISTSNLSNPLSNSSIQDAFGSTLPLCYNRLNYVLNTWNSDKSACV